MRAHLLTIIACIGGSTAHFVLKWPPTAGFEDKKSPTEPCGGFTPIVNASSPNITVDQFAVQIFNSHPAGEWGFSATLNTETPYNFTDFVPVINTTGPGNFCLQNIRVPSDWAGRQGIIQVIDHSVDGGLYQCAAVNYVSGSNGTAGPACTNATSFTATWTNVHGLNDSAESNSTGSSAATATSSTLTLNGAAAAATVMGSMLGGLGFLAAGFVL